MTATTRRGFLGLGALVGLLPFAKVEAESAKLTVRRPAPFTLLEEGDLIWIEGEGMPRRITRVTGPDEHNFLEDDGW